MMLCTLHSAITTLKAFIKYSHGNKKDTKKYKITVIYPYMELFVFFCGKLSKIHTVIEESVEKFTFL